MSGNLAAFSVLYGCVGVGLAFVKLKVYSKAFLKIRGGRCGGEYFEFRRCGRLAKTMGYIFFPMLWYSTFTRIHRVESGLGAADVVEGRKEEDAGNVLVGYLMVSAAFWIIPLAFAVFASLIFVPLQLIGYWAVRSGLAELLDWKMAQISRCALKRIAGN